jgi:alanyl-tRNA synthetase
VAKTTTVFSFSFSRTWSTKVRKTFGFTEGTFSKMTCSSPIACLGLTADLTSKYNASQMIQPLAKELGGTGGGKPDFAQAGGTQPGRIPEAFAQFKSWLETL